jgi:hypothetical protein
MFVAETGGELVSAAPEKIEETLTRLASHIAASYSLAYLPTNSAARRQAAAHPCATDPAVEQREGETAVITRP